MIILKKFTLVLILFLVSACVTAGKADYAKTKREIITGLSQIKGKFVWQAPSKDNAQIGSYDYTKLKQISDLLSSKDEAMVVKILANCIDSPATSQSTLNNKKLVLGFVCYQALNIMIYYEPTLPNGDLGGDWDGYFSITPKSSMADLKAAKRAWLKIIALGMHIFT